MATIENDATYLEGQQVTRHDINIVKSLITRAKVHERVGTAVHFLLEIERGLPPIPKALVEVTPDATEDKISFKSIVEDLDEMELVIKRYANCRNAPVELFHTVHKEVIPLAQSFCAKCSVQLECLFVGTYNISDVPGATYGGATDDMRRRIRHAYSAPTTVKVFEEFIAQQFPELLDMEFAKWEIEHAQRVFQGKTENAKYNVITKSERIARLALDHFRGEPFNQERIYDLVVSRPEYTKSKSPKGLDEESIAMNLAPGSLVRTDDGLLMFSEDGAYRSDREY